jgi:hypothetical protein
VQLTLQTRRDESPYEAIHRLFVEISGPPFEMHPLESRAVDRRDFAHRKALGGQFLLHHRP